MKITNETVDYAAALAKLIISDEEREKTRKDLENILSYIETMNEVDTEGIEAMSHVFPYKNVFREDEVKPSYDREALLAGAPKSQDGCFVVPKTVE